MHSRLLTLATAISGASAVFNGFNYGSTFSDGRPKQQSDFEAEFTAARGLDGTDGRFTSARLYTMVQAGSGNQPISAIPAAIKTKTSLLLGLWASAGQDNFNNELHALQSVIDQYCGQLDGVVAGISIGSEDLYRTTPTSQARSPDPGASPDTLVKYIRSVRSLIKGTCLQNSTIGHVDTWDAYEMEASAAVVDELDWVGMDTYPYYEKTKANGVENGAELFRVALDKVKKAAKGRTVYICETGWPVSGPTEGQAVASTQNAQTFWQTVGCPMFDNTNVWWYTFQDGAPNVPNPSFGVIGSTLGTKPLYDLSCKGHETAPSTGNSSSAQLDSKTSSSSSSDDGQKADGQGGSGQGSGQSGDGQKSGDGQGSGQSGDGQKSVDGQGSGQKSVDGQGSGQSGSGAGQGPVPTQASVPYRVPVSNGTATLPTGGSGGSGGSGPATSSSSGSPQPTSGAGRLGAFAGVAAGLVMAAAAL